MNSQTFSALQKRAHSFRFENAKSRKLRIQKLVDWISSHEDEIIKALQLDFNKPEFETQISEIMPALTEARFAIKNLENWMQEKRVPTPLSLFGHASFIRYENKGVVLIISPWNYPFQLAIVPMIAALAAGNTVIIKPSELTPQTSQLIKKLCENCFSADEVLVELGDKDKTTELLRDYEFGHVFFTGSTAVGRIIAKSCAEKLVPVTLELGGKSPTIVDETCDLKVASEKIFWGKFLNRAQTCVAPDFVVAHESIAGELERKLKLLSDQALKFDKARIITELHHQRLQNFSLSKMDLNLLPLEVLTLDNLDHPTMKDEIFGPILPIIKYRDLQNLTEILENREKPLALYIFSKNQSTIDFILNNFTSGGVGINAVLVQFGNHYLPFGGTGQSGSGQYHGYYGFLELSHKRAVIRQQFFGFLRKILMPPYTPGKYRILRWLKKF